MLSDLEKKNLEVHVEKQELRDQAINEALLDIERKIVDLVEANKELKKMIDEDRENRSNQLIKWGAAIIAALVSALGMLFIRLIMPSLIGRIH
ncbi:Uncharacterised protein [uncultured archaeon]|nr:Uncharacterised protein [uncultured archaeon]